MECDQNYRVDHAWAGMEESCFRVRSHAPSIQYHMGTKVVWPDIQPKRVPEEPVCINLFRQNPVHVVPPLGSRSIGGRQRGTLCYVTMADSCEPNRFTHFQWPHLYIPASDDQSCAQMTNREVKKCTDKCQIGGYDSSRSSFVTLSRDGNI